MTWDNFLDITADSYGLSDRQKQVFIARFSDEGAKDTNARIARILELSVQDIERALREIYNLFKNDCPELASRTRGQSEKLRKWLKQKYAETRQGVPNPISVIAPDLKPVAIAATLNTTPPPVDEWQGRQDEIKELQTAISNDKIRLIGMTAAGGYGKSALAVKFKDQLTPNWRVLWVSFIQPYPLAQFGRWLLEQLGRDYDEKWDEESLIGQIVEGLIAEHCLLVLDNMETVIPAEGKSVYGQFLSQWLENGMHSKLLLTSREQPVFSANLLPRCYWLALKGLAEADAMRLVTEDYGLTGTQKELVHFVNQMDRHPLLMQLVSSWMREELGEGVGVTEAENLGLDLFTVEGYHRDTETCVREVVAASLARLSTRLGDSLKRLSVLRGIFELGLAQGLTAEVTDAELRYLARLSLLQEFPPEPLKGKRRRFQFLSLISLVVQQQAGSELLRSAHQAALDYFLAHLPAPPWESLEDLTVYLEGFYHAGELGEWQLAFDILNEERGGEGKNKSVEEFLDLQGFYRQNAQLYEQVIAGSQREQDCYRKSLNRLGGCYIFLGQYEKAIAYQQQHYDISEEIGDRQGVVRSLGNLGVCYGVLGQHEKAIAQHQRSIDISEEIGFRQGVAISLYNIGEALLKLKNYSEAEAKIQESLVISQEINFKEITAYNFITLAKIAHQTNQPQLALTHCQAALTLSQELGIPLVKDCEELLLPSH
jgi:tetratricopeptide (TPR) repeat protein